jgi:hypothetical protein
MDSPDDTRMNTDQAAAGVDSTRCTVQRRLDAIHVFHWKERFAIHVYLPSMSSMFAIHVQVCHPCHVPSMDSMFNARDAVWGRSGSSRDRPVRQSTSSKPFARWHLCIICIK